MMFLSCFFTFFTWTLRVRVWVWLGRARVKCGPADLRTDQQANCGPNAVYPLVGPQVRIIYIFL